MNKSNNTNYWLGKEAFEQKNYAKAEEHLVAVVAAGHEFADVHNMLGIIYHQQGKFEKAVHAFQQALKINPNYTDASMNLAVIYNDMGKLDEARTVYTDARTRAMQDQTGGLDPFSLGKLSNLHKDIADIYVSFGMYDEAVDEYTRALKLNPDFVDIRTKLGIALRDAGKYNEALPHLKRAIKERPDYTPAALALALCFFKTGKSKDAQKILEDVLKSDPGNKIAEFYLMMIKG